MAKWVSRKAAHGWFKPQPPTLKPHPVPLLNVSDTTYVAHINDLAFRIQIKRDLGLAVNELGRAVMGRGWIRVQCGSSTGATTTVAACASNANEDTVTEATIDQIIDNLNSDPEN